METDAFKNTQTKTETLKSRTKTLHTELTLVGQHEIDAIHTHIAELVRATETPAMLEVVRATHSANSQRSGLGKRIDMALTEFMQQTRQNEDCCLQNIRLNRRLAAADGGPLPIVFAEYIDLDFEQLAHEIRESTRGIRKNTNPSSVAKIATPEDAQSAAREMLEAYHARAAALQRLLQDMQVLTQNLCHVCDLFIAEHSTVHHINKFTCAK